MEPAGSGLPSVLAVLFGGGRQGDLLSCGKSKEHEPCHRLDSKLNRGGCECDADLHAMGRQRCFNQSPGRFGGDALRHTRAPHDAMTIAEPRLQTAGRTRVLH